MTMDLKRVFESRRAVNFFKPECAIEDSVLKKIINLAALAPSAFNLQPWEVIAVKSGAAKKIGCHASSSDSGSERFH
jgi:putative NAD(P)H nitroreductase